MILAQIDAPRVDAPTPEASSVLFAEGMMAAGLRSIPGSEIHILSDSGPRPCQVASLQRHAAEGRISWKHLALFPQLIAEHRYIHFGPWHSYRMVGRLRAGMGEPLFPSCNVLHGSSLVETMTMATAGGPALPFDVWLVSSRAEEQALRLILMGDHKPEGESTYWIERIPPAVDTDMFRPRDSRECRKAVGVPLEATVVLCAGNVRLGRRVDVEPLISIFREASQRCPSALLVVAGVDDSRYAQELKDAVAELQAVGSIQVLTATSEHIRPLLYSAADVFVALDDNILSNPIFSAAEALACSVPVVASDWGMHRDIIEDGHSGFLIPTYWNPVAGAMMSWLGAAHAGTQFLADHTVLDTRALLECLKSLLEKPDLRREVGDAGRAAVMELCSEARVGRALGKVWQAQRDAFSCFEELLERVVDYSRAVGSHATELLQLETCLEITPRGRTLHGDDLRPGNASAVPPLLRREALRVLSRAPHGPFSIQECVSGGNELTFEAVVWLMKKGYVRQPSRNPARVTGEQEAPTQCYPQ